MSFYQEPQTRFHGGFLGAGAAVPHGLPHQLVINVNIGPHKAPLSLMCKDITFMCIEEEIRDEPSFLFLKPTYSTLSINRPETAVTHFRGLIRSASTSNQFLNPGMTRVLLAISPR
jgi:hypothetical protein